MQNYQPKVSILVPIYNVEQYLSQCLLSLVNQTLRDIEIICINDGSTDHSLQIIQQFSSKDSRIVVINKLNSGYGDSMNYGIRQAKGEYVGIVESDDWIDLGAFEKLYQVAKLNQADVVKANYYRETSSGESTKVNEIAPVDANKVFSPLDQKQVFSYAPAIWSAIYRREFLDKYHLNFLPTAGASYQDISFNFKVWALAKRAVLLDEAFLHYRIDNANSSVNNPGKVYCVVEEYAEVERFLRESGLFERLSGELEVAKFLSYHWNLQRLAPSLAKEFYARFRAEFIADSQAGLLKKSDFSKKNWLALQSILKHPKFAYNILRIHNKIKHKK